MVKRGDMYLSQAYNVHTFPRYLLFPHILWGKECILCFYLSLTREYQNKVNITPLKTRHRYIGEPILGFAFVQKWKTAKDKENMKWNWSSLSFPISFNSPLAPFPIACLSVVLNALQQDLVREGWLAGWEQRPPWHFTTIFTITTTYSTLLCTAMYTPVAYRYSSLTLDNNGGWLLSYYFSRFRLKPRPERGVSNIKSIQTSESKMKIHSSKNLLSFISTRFHVTWC